jgi:hypothetical protein
MKWEQKIKPVQLTVIKDKKIVRDVIAEIHRKPAQKDMTCLRVRRRVLEWAEPGESVIQFVKSYLIVFFGKYRVYVAYLSEMWRKRRKYEK